MATFKVDMPDDLTGDSAYDIENLYNFVCNMASSLNYHMNNIDDENLSDSILSQIGANNNGE